MPDNPTVTERGVELAWKLNPYIGTTTAINYTCSVLRKHAVTYAKLCEEGCNGPAWKDQPGAAWTGKDIEIWQADLDKRQDYRKKRITELVASLPHTEHGPIGVQFDGDPRGYTVRLLVPTENGPAREIGVA